MGYRPGFEITEAAEVLWLHDGDEAVICFDPEHLGFGHGRLAPGGYEMFPAAGTHWSAGGWFCPFWGYQVGRPNLLSAEADADGEQGTFWIRTHREGGPVESDWKMRVTFDEDLAGHVYDIETTASVVDTPDPSSYSPYEFEYFDLYPTGLLDYKTAPRIYRDGEHCPGPGPVWDYCVYQTEIAYERSRHWIKAPLNRFVTTAQNNFRTKRDGLVGFINNPVGNPMIQLVGDTAAVTTMSLCNWFYDLHLLHDLARVQEPPEVGISVTVNFRIMSYDFAHTQPILEKAALPGYPEDEYEAKRFPRYEESGLNSFEKAVTIDAPDHSRIWRPFHDYLTDYDPGLTDVRQNNCPDSLCLWDRSCGRTGASSLSVKTVGERIAGWQLPLFERPNLTPGKRYRLSVYVRTTDLEGKGATLGYLLGRDKTWSLRNKEEGKTLGPVFADTWVKGSSDWQEVVVQTPVVENVRLGGFLDCELYECCVQPVLWHEGDGQSWFDDFTLEEVEG